MKKIILMLLFFIMTNSVNAFLAPSAGTIASISLKGIIPLILIMVTSFFIALKLKIKRNKIKTILLIIILLIFTIFIYRFLELRNLNKGITELKQNNGKYDKLIRFYNENYIDLSNYTLDYLNKYKVISTHKIGPTSGNLLKPTDVNIYDCFFDFDCITKKMDERGINKEDNLILYCLSGVSSARIGITLKNMGYKNIRITGIANNDNIAIFNPETELEIENIKQDYILIEKLKKEDRDKHSYNFIYFGIDDLDMFYLKNYAVDFKNSLHILNQMNLGFENKSGESYVKINETYTIIDSIKDIKNNSRFICTNALNCILTQQYLYNSNSNEKVIYKLIDKNYVFSR